MSEEQDNEIKEPTAFFREMGIAQAAPEKLGFKFQEVYDDIYKAMLPHMFEHQRSPRALASIAMSFTFDLVTTAMAITKYDEDLSFEQDLTAFIEAIMIMLNASTDGVGANGRLLIDKKSIFNIKEKLNS